MSTIERYGDWNETFTGVHFYPLDPRPEEILPQDIAHALSQICRFTGHTKWFYSVGQHCVLCAEYARYIGHDAAVQLRALLHDASEAYICDVSRPVKPYLKGYGRIEEKLQGVIYERFGLPAADRDADLYVKMIDDHLLCMEARQLMPKAEWAANVGNDHMRAMIITTPMKTIESVYLQLLGDLRVQAGDRTAGTA